jgi:hypothetical protein
MPMQPSTHVTHIPEDGTTESSVLFLVRVAAEAFGLETGAGIVFYRSFLHGLQQGCTG